MSRIRVGGITTNAADLILEPAFVEKKIDVLVAQGVKDHPEWIRALDRHLSSRVNPFADNVVDMLGRCPRPANAQEAMAQVASLLTLPNILKALAWERIGRLLVLYSIDTKDVVTGFGARKRELYGELVEECSLAGCPTCQACDGTINHPPCGSVQFTFKVVQTEFTNATKTHLEACKRLHRKVDTCMPMVMSGLVPTSSIKAMSNHYNSNDDEEDVDAGFPNPSAGSPIPSAGSPIPSAGSPIPSAVDSPIPSAGSPIPSAVDSPIPSPVADEHMEADTPLDSGMNNTFALLEGKDPSTAVHYVDGDGGHLVGDFFPGLLDFARSQNIPCQNVQPHDVTLVPFREFGDDAPELGHVYYLGGEEAAVCSTSSRANTATRVVVPFGYHALVHARKLMATCTTVTVVAYGKDAGGGRLLVELFRDQRTHSTGVERIKAGLSYPTLPVSTLYMQAYQRARRDGVGLHQYHLVDKEVLPGALKQKLQILGAHFTHTTSIDNIKCVIINENTYLNESHVLEMMSTIPGAGMAAFLRPTPPGRSAYTIPGGARICLYSDQLVVEADQENTDYLLVREGGDVRMAWNPLVPDGANYGRLVNQGGLEEGLKALVASCDIAAGSNHYSANEAEAVFLANCNVTYRHSLNRNASEERRHQLEVVASRAIRSSSTHAIELLGNYGIGYWIPYIVKHHEEWGLDNPLVKCVLWLLLSEKSTMGRQEREAYLGEGEHSLVTQDIREQFQGMECPFPITTRKRKRPP